MTELARSRLPDDFAGCQEVREVGRGQVLEYIFRPEPRERHEWILRGPPGAAHVWAMRCPELRMRIEDLDLPANVELPDFMPAHWIGGIERHYHRCPSLRVDSRITHERCWILDGPCFHEGSSSGFEGMVGRHLPEEDMGDMTRSHDEILSVLRRTIAWMTVQVANGDV